MNPFSLSGKTALVVGASRGIGLAIAQLAARSGARVLMAARSLDALERNAAALRAEGHQAETVVLDIANRDALADVVAGLPDIDILINVSGTNIRKAMPSYTVAEYERILDTNLHGLFFLTQKMGARMIERGQGGKVIYIGSLMSLLGLPYLTVYAMTKSALAGLTRSLAAEWGRHNIQVNCIAPGFIVTDLNRDMWQSPVMNEWLRGCQAAPHTGVPEDIAPLAVFLSSPGSNYITGQVIAADGGYTTTAVWPFEPA